MKNVIPMFPAFLTILCIATFSYAISPKEILEKTDSVRAPFESFVMDVNISSPGGNMSFKVHSKRGEDSLVLYLKPKSESGKLLLMKEESLWIYIPGTRRALRITPMQRLMGGISNGDISRLRWSLDYEAGLTGENDKTYELDLTALKKSATYHHLTITVEKGTFKPVKAVVYLKSGKLYKTIYFTGFRKFSGKIMATDLKFIDHLKSDEESIMTFSDVRSEAVPARYFNRTELPRLSETLSAR